MIRSFDRSQLLELMGPVEGLAVSIYLPTDHTGQRASAERLKFRGAIDRVRKLLGKDAPEGLVDHLDAALKWADEGGLKDGPADGLALLASKDESRIFRLPVRFPDKTVVADTYLTRPLVEALQVPDAYWVLALSAKRVQLFRGDSSGLAAVDVPDLPGSRDEALPGERDTATELRKEIDDKVGLAKFFHALDAPLRAALAADDAPLVLAAVQYYHPLFADATHLGDRLADEGIEANVDVWDVTRLAAEARPILDKQVRARAQAWIDRWDKAYGGGKGEPDAAAAARLAVASRVRVLLLERGAQLPGVVDRDTGEIAEGPETADALDDLAEIVVAKGGEVFIVDDGALPTGTGLAAILR